MKRYCIINDSVFCIYDTKTNNYEICGEHAYTRISENLLPKILKQKENEFVKFNNPNNIYLYTKKVFFMKHKDIRTIKFIEKSKFDVEMNTFYELSVVLWTSLGRYYRIGDRFTSFDDLLNYILEGKKVVYQGKLYYAQTYKDIVSLYDENKANFVTKCSFDECSPIKYLGISNVHYK